MRYAVCVTYHYGMLICYTYLVVHSGVGHTYCMWRYAAILPQYTSVCCVTWYGMVVPAAICVARLWPDLHACSEVAYSGVACYEHTRTSPRASLRSLGTPRLAVCSGSMAHLEYGSPQ